MLEIKNKKSGVLMPIFSLPSPYLIGDFGKEAYEFAKLISDAHYDYWQVLPLNTLGFGNSPYQTLSSKALDPIYISIDLLKEDNLIHNEYPKVYTDTIDYEMARQLKLKALKEAYSNFKEDNNYLEFIKQDWLIKYTTFISFKKANDNKCWNEWDKEYKDYPLTNNKELFNKHIEDIKFEMFIQYKLFEQFNKLKKYINSLGLKIIGDIPFYVGIDSDDVYYHRDLFELDKDGKPTWIAGVPPDYFNDLGQRWGNPIYNWDNIQKQDYKFWFDRLKFNSNVFDILRLDHFRAFDTYWKIDAKEETAINGEWIINCGDDFFDKFIKKYPEVDMIAEDLGDLRPEVLELRDKYNFIGMRILQFTFFEEDKEKELIYIGNHDNDSLTLWYKAQEKSYQEKIKDYMKEKYPNKSLYNAILQYALDLKSLIVILMVNDIILDDRKINSPGTIGSPNWEYKLKDFNKLKRRLKLIDGKRT